MQDITRILSRIEQGDPSASQRLLPIVYEELRRLADVRMAKERPDHTLDATGLVHEAYLRLVDSEQEQRWNGRGHFFAAAANSMRRILVDHARKKGSQKRGGNLQRLDIDSIDMAVTAMPGDLLAIDEALTMLCDLDPVAAELVQLRYFAGLTIEQAAQNLSVSPATAYRHWNYARAWLHRELLENEGS